MSVHKLVEKKLDGKQQKLAAQDHRGTAKFVDQRSSAQTTTELQNTILSANDAPTNLVLQQKRGIEESPILQRKSSRDGLPPQLQSGIEALSGMSMNHVQVHYNSPKPATLQAHAYAQGSQIHLGPGQEKHLPHEAWHVVQQGQ